jgi:hypothetical protein
MMYLHWPWRLDRLGPQVLALAIPIGVFSSCDKSVLAPSRMSPQFDEYAEYYDIGLYQDEFFGEAKVWQAGQGGYESPWSIWSAAGLTPHIPFFSTVRYVLTGHTRVGTQSTAIYYPSSTDYIVGSVNGTFPTALDCKTITNGGGHAATTAYATWKILVMVRTGPTKIPITHTHDAESHDAIDCAAYHTQDPPPEEPPPPSDGGGDTIVCEDASWCPPDDDPPVGGPANAPEGYWAWTCWAESIPATEEMVEGQMVICAYVWIEN